jgi:hypothetical protein
VRPVPRRQEPRSHGCHRFRTMEALAAVCLLLAAPARAASTWWDEASLRTQVHEHAFHRVTANAIGCLVRARLYFSAPEAAYQGGSSERNHYRFRARVQLSDRSFDTEVFGNGVAGARVFAFSQDTATEGCWAEKQHSLRQVTVHACRGQGCIPEPF